MNKDKKLTILYVDDEEINTFIFIHNFSMYNVITAKSGIQALKILQENNSIDAVISDMSMPAMNGVEFITSANAKFPQLPYFILTAYSYNNELDQALKDKLVIECFPKPLNVEKIRESVENVVN